MIKEVVRYSAVTAKARAMYGKCLRGEDWERLREMSGLREVRDFLAAQDAWSAVGDDPAAAENAQSMAAALSRQLERDCRSLCLYLKKRDAETLRFFLRSPADGEMTPEEERRWWREGGAKNAGLRRIAGAEADALNIVYILRLRRFPGSLDRAGELLIPVRYKLTAELSRRLAAAEDDAAVRRILDKTIWKGAFRSLEPGELEKQYTAYMDAFCRRVLAQARPGLVAAQAFMTLKDMERARLTRAVGAIAQGIDPRAVI